MSTGGPQKLEAQGGKEGKEWDDGAEHDGVTKIYVAAGGLGIEQIRFDYVKNGQPKEGSFHGVKGRSTISTIEISHPAEYLISMEGWYDSTNIIQGIQFKSNKHTSQYFGYEFLGDGTQFSLQVNDNKIISFHGFADSHLNSVGAYFAPISSSLTTTSNKVEAQGGNGGETFDDGVFDHVRKVYVGQGESGVAYVKFEYEKDGKRETRDHGKMTLLGTEEFEVDSDDYITSIEVSVDKVFGYNSEIVTALVFKTSKGTTSPPFGMVTEKKFELKDGNGGKLAGFHGKASDVLYALGAYFAPSTTSTTPSTTKKLQARGGNGGASWDDGVFDGVRKILVGQGNDGVAFVTFEYNKGSQAILGDGHGKKTLLGTETFELDYPSEYITSVEGYYDKIFGVEAEVVTSLMFKTNKRTSQPFGMTAGEHFELKEDGYKVVGFHGKAGDLVHQIGVHIVPIFTNYRVAI
nr:At1g52040/F5F19_10 [Arabidopsis thaliana]